MNEYFKNLDKGKLMYIFGGIGCIYMIGLIKGFLSTASKNLYKFFTSNKQQNILICKEYKAKKLIELNKFLNDYKDYVPNDIKNLILSKKNIKEFSQSLKNKEFTIKQATVVFLIRSLTYGKDNCWIADFNIVETLMYADEVEKRLENNNDIESDLFGVPFSVKENINIKGFKTTFAYMKFLTLERNFDGYIIKVLKKKGAIPIVKSNVPQGLMSYDSFNGIWGRAKNPWDNEFLSGGSSGGEGSLVATKCTFFGIGSDLGGSIRIPSLNNGVYGFKPSFSKISKIGSIGFDGTGNYSIPLISASYGPIARNISDLKLFCNELFGCFPEDHTCSQLQFKNPTEKIIRVGVYKENIEFVATTQEIKNKIDEIINFIKEKSDMKQKYNFKEVDISPFLNERNSLFYKSYELLMNSNVLEISSEQIDEDKMYFIDRFLKFNKDSNFKKKLTNLWIETFNSVRSNHYYKNCKTLNSIREYNDLIANVNKLKYEFIGYLKSQEIDVLILPSSPIGGALHQDLNDLDLFNMKYMFFSNVCDFPVLNLPVSIISTAEYNDKFNDSITRKIIKNLEISKGKMPIGIQICSFSGNDELVLEVSEDFDTVFKFSNELEKKTMEKFN